jgi:sedoheptulokinase
VVVEAGRGVVASRTAPNDSSLPATRPGERLQDAGRLLALAQGAVRWARREAPRARALGVTGQQHGAVYVDASCRPVGPLVTWQDGRGDWMAEDETFVQRMTRLAGRPMASGLGLASHFVSVSLGEVPAGAACLATVADVLAAQLAGLARPVCHPSMAASLGLYDLSAEQFDGTALAAAGLDPGILPAVDASERPLGSFDGIMVGPAIGDNQASVLGAAGPAGGAVVNIGTGSQFSVLIPGHGLVSAAPPGLEVRPHIAGDRLLVGSALAGGAAYGQLRDMFAQCGRLAGAPDPGPGLFGPMNEAALAALTGDGVPLRVDTRFSGTRQDRAVRGAVTGIGLDNFTPGALAAGVLAGIADELAALGRTAQQVTGTPARLVAAGNAVRRNPALRLALERAFGRVALVPAGGEEAATGAALFALQATGLAGADGIGRSIRYVG